MARFKALSSLARRDEKFRLVQPGSNTGVSGVQSGVNVQVGNWATKPQQSVSESKRHPLMGHQLVLRNE
jgi:hypothetical protein